MRVLSDFLAVGSLTADDQTATEWQPLTEHDLLIFVGLTGVGKTTTLDSLSTLGFIFDPLPNRRTLTDDLLIAELQLADGEPIVAVHDREQRFAYTRRYRDLYAGGMAHALAQLAVKRAAAPREIPYLFDGLRGANEVTYAAQQMPRARFIVLTASDFVRVQRLLKRNDAFDQINIGQASEKDPLSLSKNQDESDTLKQNELKSNGAATQNASVDELLGEATSLFTPDEQRQLHEWIKTGAVDIAEMQAKLKIVLTERQNYDSAASVRALQSVAPKRTLVVDTAIYSPEQIAEQIMAFSA